MLSGRDPSHTHNACTIFVCQDVTFIGDSSGIRLKSIRNYSLKKIFTLLTRFTGINHAGRETGTDNILSPTREKTEVFYEMIFAMINELKSMNTHDEDCEEFRTFKKEYEVEERRGYDDISFRKDILSLVQ